MSSCQNNIPSPIALINVVWGGPSGLQGAWDVRAYGRVGREGGWRGVQSRAAAHLTREREKGLLCSLYSHRVNDVPVTLGGRAGVGGRVGDQMTGAFIVLINELKHRKNQES